MNVFVLDEDVEQRARYHCDTHNNKMLLEAIQIANTALHHNGCDDVAFYDPTHTTHPWCSWASESKENWLSLIEHARALTREFIRRRGKSHASAEKMAVNWFDGFGGLQDDVQQSVEANFDSTGDTTRAPLCMPDEYKDEDDVVESYRRYYANEKYPQDWCTWTLREVPAWIFDYV
jgi:hypothetical protein